MPSWRRRKVTGLLRLAWVGALATAAIGAGVLLSGRGATAARQADATAVRHDYAAVTEHLTAFIEHEMRDKQLPALSIALVEDEQTVWARGFGYADPDRRIPATEDTVYRVGSVSKLFTDIGVMQLVERGDLDLDAPVTRYLPDFRPRNPFGTAVTLRQLMSHRSGLIREPPVGNYFDPTEPSLAEMVASLEGVGLVYAPESRTKYSNAGIAVVGYVLERTQGRPFAEYLRGAVLEPLGMRDSHFEPTPAIQRDLAKAYMWTYDGRTFEAPRFQLGMAPAGSMYSTVTDLGRFMSVLFAGGRSEQGPVVSSETLAQMYTPQFAEPGATTGFGIGFAVSDLDGRRLVRHGGAIYGFATELAFLPDERLGVVAVTTLDVTNTVVSRLSRYALQSMLAVRQGDEPTSPVLSRPVEAARARDLEGRYVAEDDPAEVVELIARGARLWMLRGGARVDLKSLGGTLVVDDRIGYGTTVAPVSTGIELDGRPYRRAPVEKPAAAPERWAGLVGEYGWDHNTLYILEKGGQLHALIEWTELDPLEEISEDVFAFPDRGLYPGEQLVFTRDARGAATRVEAASVVFERRPIGVEEGETFRITPRRPVDELRRVALSAEPPEEPGDFRAPDLMELTELDQTIRLDVRYATTNNFMGAVFYRQPRAFLQRPAAEALVRVHRALEERGYGLLIHDAYRPWHVTKMFFDATPDEQKIFVADPADGSRHNRGSAVDLTLYERSSGRVVQMVGGYDEFSTRSYPDYQGGTSLQRWHRELLRDAMEAEGFDVYEFEWWHFDYADWREYPILNLTFEELEESRSPRPQE